MKYICLGYIQPGKFENMSESERTPCWTSVLPTTTNCEKNGHFAAGEALQPANTAMTVYWKNGKVAVTDGPYAERRSNWVEEF